MLCLVLADEQPADHLPDTSPIGAEDDLDPNILDKLSVDIV
jgi:hypothetical protein